MANHIVGINDKLSSLVDELDCLHQARFLPLCEGRRLQLENTFLENNVQDKAKIVLIGNQQNVKIVNQSLKFYHRFSDFKLNDDWSVGPGQWDALLITPKVNVTIYGVGVFQEYPKGTANF